MGQQCLRHRTQYLPLPEQMALGHKLVELAERAEKRLIDPGKYSNTATLTGVERRRRFLCAGSRAR